MISRTDIEDMTDAQGPDTAKLQRMRDANWRPAVDYWRERAEKAEADLARPSQAGDERVAEAMEACRIIDAAVKEGHDSVSDLLMHLLEAAVPARAALAAMDTPKGGGDA